VPGFNKRDEEREQYVIEDHGRPPYKVHVVSTATGTEKKWTEWAYCPICLASKDGHYRNGRARFSGGRIRVQYRCISGALRLTEGRCTCKHGDKYAEREDRPATFMPYKSFYVGQKLIAKHHGVTGEVVKIWIPGEGPGVRVERLNP